MRNLTKVLILILTLLFSSGLGSLPDEDTSILNTPAPDFSLKDLDGNIYTLSEYTKDKVVIISFFATWCPPCRAEIPHLLEFAKLSQGLPIQIWLIDVQESEDTVKKFIQENRINIPVLLDKSGEIARKYGVSGIPALFIINRAGNTVYKVSGFNPEIKNILREQTSALIKKD